MVQRQNVLLATTAINTRDTLDGFALNVSQPAGSTGPTNDGTPWNSVTTSVVLPSIAKTIWISEPGTDVAIPFTIPTEPFNKSIRLGSTIGLAAGRGAVAMRIFAADTAATADTASSSSQSGGGAGVMGEADGVASLYLAGDDQGMPLGAIRLVAYHYRGHYRPPSPVTGKDTHLRFGALIKTAAVPDPTAGTASADSDPDHVQANVVTQLVQSLVKAEITATTTQHDQSGAMLWNVSATIDPTEPDGRGMQRQNDVVIGGEQVRLAVDRNLTCSESLLDNKNQSSECGGRSVGCAFAFLDAPLLSLTLISTLCCFIEATLCIVCVVISTHCDQARAELFF